MVGVSWTAGPRGISTSPRPQWTKPQVLRPPRPLRLRSRVRTEPAGSRYLMYQERVFTRWAWSRDLS
eukprot:940859-Lingulodinium_polyedra.AAC.1